MIKLGRYRHYKNKEYEVLGTCYLAGPATECVLYRQLYDTPDFPNGTLWVRPINEFTEYIEVDGVKMLRYTPVD